MGKSFDYVITVCDRARESCPAFPGSPIRIHWSIPDPAAVQAPEGDPAQPFQVAAEDLEERIDYFLVRLSRQS